MSQFNNKQRIKMKKIITTAAISIALTMGIQAKESKSPVSVTSASYQLVPKRDKKHKIVKDKKGKPIMVWAKASKVVPGTVVKYVDTVSNDTNETLSDVAIKNPINPHLTFVVKSAKCESGCKVLYSIDGGKHFDVPAKLMVKNKKTGKKRLAVPKEYNAIEWVIASVPANSKTTVEFKAKLK
jgi:uncharacterized repeat protein (TIGR01451 family)